MRRAVSILATAAMAAGLALSSATPSSAAGPYCFGLPSEPLAYVCVTVHDPTVPDPTITWGEPSPVGYVPAVCYGVGCTEEGPVYVSIPWVTGVGVPSLVEIYWAGHPGRIDIESVVASIREIAENPGMLCSLIGPSYSCLTHDV